MVAQCASTGSQSSRSFAVDIRESMPNGLGTATESPSVDLRSKYFQYNARKWWKVDILVNALSALNYPVTVKCVSSTNSMSPMVYYPDKNLIEISPWSFWSPFSFRRALARGMVYAFDNARAHVDYNNLDHVVCTSIRGVNISGECDLWTKWTDYIGEDPLGKNMYSMKQRCMRERVKESVWIVAGNDENGSERMIDESMNKVWDRCFRDHWPFTTEPHMDTRFRESPFSGKGSL